MDKGENDEKNKDEMKETRTKNTSNGDVHTAV